MLRTFFPLSISDTQTLSVYTSHTNSLVLSIYHIYMQVEQTLKVSFSTERDRKCGREQETKRASKRKEENQRKRSLNKRVRSFSIINLYMYIYTLMYTYTHISAYVGSYSLYIHKCVFTSIIYVSAHSLHVHIYIYNHRSSARGSHDCCRYS